MAATGSVSVSNAAWTAVTAQSHCRNVRVTENRGATGYPNGDFLVNKTVAGDKVGIAAPPSSPISVRIQGGASYIFNCPQGKFNAGQIVGYIQMVNTVSTTFDQDEDAI